jgi:hypothetical protein
MERREMSLAQSEDWGFSNRSHRAAEHATFQTITIICISAFNSIQIITEYGFESD